ncbi:MAG: Ig-like domain-containing protein, partial [Planctomycetes bacterium]|nr:Ig-like domain-containing protein [Planctomycetota bacterium]
LIDAEGNLVSSGDGTNLDQTLLPRDTPLTPSPTPETALPEEASAPAAARTEGPPRIVSTAPPAGATDVDPHLSEISVAFDRDMARGFSWTGGGQVYPEVTDRPQWVDNRTCVLPVKLEEGRYYRVGINSKSHRNFKAAYGAPALPTAIYFCTKGSSDQTKQKVQVPEVVRLVPANGAKDVSPETKEIQVTFSVPMGGGFSWTGGGANYPKGTGNPYWSDDGKTCTRPVRLRPGWNYRLGLNSPSHNNFRSRWGVPLPRVLWTFSTSGQTPRQGQTTEKSGEPDKTVVVGRVTDIDIVLDQAGRD